MPWTQPPSVFARRTRVCRVSFCGLHTLQHPENAVLQDELSACPSHCMPWVWWLTAVCCAVASWPGLATVLVKSIERELGALGRKKGPDSTVSKTFKRFVQTADDERRSGAHHQTPLCTATLRSLGTVLL